jgi:hypothetical protein
VVAVEWVEPLPRFKLEVALEVARLHQIIKGRALLAYLVKEMLAGLAQFQRGRQLLEVAVVVLEQ